MKSIEELALKVAKEMWNSNGVYSGHPLSEMQEFATRFLAAYTEQQEPFVVTQFDPYANPGGGIWLEGKDKDHFFPYGTKLYAAPVVPADMVLVSMGEIEDLKAQIAAYEQQGSGS